MAGSSDGYTSPTPSSDRRRSTADPYAYSAAAATDGYDPFAAVGSTPIVAGNSLVGPRTTTFGLASLLDSGVGGGSGPQAKAGRMSSSAASYSPSNNPFFRAAEQHHRAPRADSSVGVGRTSTNRYGSATAVFSNSNSYSGYGSPRASEGGGRLHSAAASHAPVILRSPPDRYNTNNNNNNLHTDHHHYASDNSNDTTHHVSSTITTKRFVSDNLSPPRGKGDHPASGRVRVPSRQDTNGVVTGHEGATATVPLRRVVLPPQDHYDARHYQTPNRDGGGGESSATTASGLSVSKRIRTPPPSVDVSDYAQPPELLRRQRLAEQQQPSISISPSSAHRIGGRERGTRREGRKYDHTGEDAYAYETSELDDLTRAEMDVAEDYNKGYEYVEVDEDSEDEGEGDNVNEAEAKARGNAKKATAASNEEKEDATEGAAAHRQLLFLSQQPTSGNEEIITIRESVEETDLLLRPEVAVVRLKSPIQVPREMANTNGKYGKEGKRRGKGAHIEEGNNASTRRAVAVSEEGQRGDDAIWESPLNRNTNTSASDAANLMKHDEKKERPSSDRLTRAQSTEPLARQGAQNPIVVASTSASSDLLRVEMDSSAATILGGSGASGGRRTGNSNSCSRPQTPTTPSSVRDKVFIVPLPPSVKSISSLLSGSSSLSQSNANDGGSRGTTEENSSNMSNGAALKMAGQQRRSQSSGGGGKNFFELPPPPLSQQQRFAGPHHQQRSNSGVECSTTSSAEDKTLHHTSGSSNIVGVAVPTPPLSPKIAAIVRSPKIPRLDPITIVEQQPNTTVTSSASLTQSFSSSLQQSSSSLIALSSAVLLPPSAAAVGSTTGGSGELLAKADHTENENNNNNNNNNNDDDNCDDLQRKSEILVNVREHTNLLSLASSAAKDNNGVTTTTTSTNSAVENENDEFDFSLMSPLHGFSTSTQDDDDDLPLGNIIETKKKISSSSSAAVTGRSLRATTTSGREEGGVRERKRERQQGGIDLEQFSSARSAGDDDEEEEGRGDADGFPPAIRSRRTSSSTATELNHHSQSQAMRATHAAMNNRTAATSLSYGNPFAVSAAMHHRRSGLNSTIIGAPRPSSSFSSSFLEIINSGGRESNKMFSTPRPPPPRMRLMPAKPTAPLPPSPPPFIDRSGFINVGNSCYASSVLTILLRNRSFFYHLRHFVASTVSAEVKRLREGLAELLRDLDVAIERKSGSGGSTGSNSNSHSGCSLETLLLFRQQLIKNLLRLGGGAKRNNRNGKATSGCGYSSALARFGIVDILSVSTATPGIVGNSDGDGGGGGTIMRKAGGDVEGVSSSFTFDDINPSSLCPFGLKVRKRFAEVPAEACVRVKDDDAKKEGTDELREEEETLGDARIKEVNPQHHDDYSHNVEVGIDEHQYDDPIESASDDGSTPRDTTEEQPSLLAPTAAVDTNAKGKSLLISGTNTVAGSNNNNNNNNNIMRSLGNSFNGCAAGSSVLDFLDTLQQAAEDTTTTKTTKVERVAKEKECPSVLSPSVGNATNATDRRVAPSMVTIDSDEEEEEEEGSSRGNTQNNKKMFHILRLHNALLEAAQLMFIRDREDEKANEHNEKLYERCMQPFSPLSSPKENEGSERKKKDILPHHQQDVHISYAQAKHYYETVAIPRWEKQCSSIRSEHAKAMARYNANDTDLESNNEERDTTNNGEEDQLVITPQDDLNNNNSDLQSNNSKQEDKLGCSDFDALAAFNAQHRVPSYITEAQLSSSSSSSSSSYVLRSQQSGINPTTVGLSKVLHECGGFFDGDQHDASEFLTTVVARLESEVLAFYRWVAFVDAALGERYSNNRREHPLREKGVALTTKSLSSINPDGDLCVLSAPHALVLGAFPPSNGENDDSSKTSVAAKKENEENPPSLAGSSRTMPLYADNLPLYASKGLSTSQRAWLLAVTLSEVPIVFTEASEEGEGGVCSDVEVVEGAGTRYGPLVALLDLLEKSPIRDVRLAWINALMQGRLFATTTCKGKTTACGRGSSSRTGRRDGMKEGARSLPLDVCGHKNISIDTFVTFSVGLPNFTRELEEESKKILEAATTTATGATSCPQQDFTCTPPSSDINRRIEFKLEALRQRIEQKESHLRTGPRNTFDLQRLIENGLAEDKVEDYRCDKCGDRQFQFVEARFALPMPPTLMINLKRFQTEWDSVRQRVAIDKNSCGVKINRFLFFDIKNKYAERNVKMFSKQKEREEPSSTRRAERKRSRGRRIEGSGAVIDLNSGDEDDIEDELAETTETHQQSDQQTTERLQRHRKVASATKFRHFYALVGVVNHYGRTPYSGHYVSSFRYQSAVGAAHLSEAVEGLTESEVSTCVAHGDKNMGTVPTTTTTTSGRNEEEKRHDRKSQGVKSARRTPTPPPRTSSTAKDVEDNNNNNNDNNNSDSDAEELQYYYELNSSSDGDEEGERERSKQNTKTSSDLPRGNSQQKKGRRREGDATPLLFSGVPTSARNHRRPATRAEPFLKSCLLTDPFDPRCPFVTSEDASARLFVGRVPSLSLAQRAVSNAQESSTKKEEELEKGLKEERVAARKGKENRKGFDELNFSLRHLHTEGNTFRHANDSRVSFIGLEESIKRSYKAFPRGLSGGTNEEEVEGPTLMLGQRETVLWYEQEEHAYILSYQLVAIVPIFRETNEKNV